MLLRPRALRRSAWYIPFRPSRIPSVSLLIKSLSCDPTLATGYSSPTQIARVVTEQWCSANLYCAGCDADSVEQAPANTRAIDFRCGTCKQSYQVKSQKSLNLNRVVDGSYQAMLDSVQRNEAPNLVILNYGPTWNVRRLFLIPSVFFTQSVVERRAPLSETARRAGWVGCNLLLANVPEEGKIGMVTDAGITPATLVREEFKRHQRLAAIDWKVRGWTLDVLRIVHRLGEVFSLQDVYGYDGELSRLHPSNKNVKPKIRQQLQVLRDMGYLEFLGDGNYRLR